MEPGRERSCQRSQGGRGATDRARATNGATGGEEPPTEHQPWQHRGMAVPDSANTSPGCAAQNELVRELWH